MSPSITTSTSRSASSFAAHFAFASAEETREVKPGGTWLIPADVPHEVHTGPDGALALEVWSPPREDWKELEGEEPRPPGWPD